MIDWHYECLHIMDQRYFHSDKLFLLKEINEHRVDPAAMTAVDTNGRSAN